MDVEGNAIGDAKTEFLKDVFFASRGSIGMPVKILGASFLGFPVSCGQRNESNGGVGHGPIIPEVFLGVWLRDDEKRGVSEAAGFLF